ncbi:MAG: PTS sugar transporter subunit IIC, partial [Allobaculum sp.]|nr:PTS sugar transporter subunit IIC [Allobaculum sp.]
IDFIPFFFGFTLAASLGINLVSATIIAAMFAFINYRIKMLQISKPIAALTTVVEEEEEEDI